MSRDVFGESDPGFSSNHTRHRGLSKAVVGLLSAFLSLVVLTGPLPSPPVSHCRLLLPHHCHYLYVTTAPTAPLDYCYRHC